MAQEAAWPRSSNGSSPNGQTEEDEVDEGLSEIDRLDPERRRLVAARDKHEPWALWGPYLSERQWGTVREDYSAHGTAWDYFPHDHARSRAYRWGEDGLLGICDDHGLLCFGLALWNEEDPILKERLFGLTGPEGNHGEDVKEYYFYLDNTPTHSYMKALYRYPQRAFPYSQLVEENHRRTRQDPEFELIDTGVLAENRFWDITVEYAKATPHDMLIRVTCTNQGPDPARLHLLPSLWFRNTWRWGLHERYAGLALAAPPAEPPAGEQAVTWIQSTHYKLGSYWLACQGQPECLFTENETNSQRLWGTPNATSYVKDGIHAAVVEGKREAVDPKQNGTKAAAHYRLELGPGATQTVLLRFCNERGAQPFDGAEALFAQRRAEADAFYAARIEPGLSADG
ncbi:MAG TPA: hypothetical protein VFI42_01615, partial [Thermomicrobiaceae bacterium]|nr:hypothetical protein [Thermomicrobiaceae bacterium]